VELGNRPARPGKCCGESIQQILERWTDHDPTPPELCIQDSDDAWKDRRRRKGKVTLFRTSDVLQFFVRFIPACLDVPAKFLNRGLELRCGLFRTLFILFGFGYLFL
jgi:hypothetical protein